MFEVDIYEDENNNQEQLNFHDEMVHAFAVTEHDVEVDEFENLVCVTPE